MLKVIKSTHVRAPTRSVFEYVADTASNPEWIPSLVEVHDIEGDGLGRHYKWTYTMLGVKLHGTSEVVEWEPDARVVTQSGGSVASTWRHEMEPEGDGTRYTLTVSYDIPNAVGRRFAEALLRRRNAREGELAVENLREHVESRVVASPA